MICSITISVRLEAILDPLRNSTAGNFRSWIGSKFCAPRENLVASGDFQWATTHGVAVLGLHHTRKGAADDPLEALSGSNGLSACADTTIVLDQDQNGRTLYVRGRDVE